MAVLMEQMKVVLKVVSRAFVVVDGRVVGKEIEWVASLENVLVSMLVEN